MFHKRKPMPSPYEYDDYRTYFRVEVNARKSFDSSVNFQNMATSMRVQKPFFSKVINGHNHLTQDQLYLACRYLKLSKHESDFVNLTRDYQTSSLKVRQDELKSQIQFEQSKYLETENHLSSNLIEPGPLEAPFSEYYLDPLFQVVHMALTIDRYSKDLKLLASDINFPYERITFALERLETMGIVKRDGSRIKIVKQNLHLSRSAKEYPAWNSQLRLASLTRSQNLSQNEAYGFSVVFSTDEVARREIQSRFLKFINSVQKLTEHSKEENLYQLNFDLFNWNSPVKNH
jgi:hypothetical protein